MMAREAIYHDGRVFFLFDPPEVEHPVKVLVIFPDSVGDFNDWAYWEEADEVEEGAPET